MTSSEDTNPADHTPPAGAVTLSFDDGWRSVYENAFPILRAQGIRATHYIISGYLDDSQFPSYMNAGQLMELVEAGHEIACHTVSHRHLPQEADALIGEEIALSKRFLSEHGFPPETFAYPYGEYDERVVAAVRTAGFLAARCTERGYNDHSSDRFLLKVQAVKAATRFAEVKSWIDRAMAEDLWLVLMFHQIDREGREWSTTPEMLERIAIYIKASGIRTPTVREGAALLL